MGFRSVVRRTTVVGEGGHQSVTVEAPGGEVAPMPSSHDEVVATDGPQLGALGWPRRVIVYGALSPKFWM